MFAKACSGNRPFCDVIKGDNTTPGLVAAPSASVGSTLLAFVSFRTCGRSNKRWELKPNIFVVGWKQRAKLAVVLLLSVLCAVRLHFTQC